MTSHTSYPLSSYLNDSFVKATFAVENLLINSLILNKDFNSPIVFTLHFLDDSYLHFENGVIKFNMSNKSTETMIDSNDFVSQLC